MCEPGRMDTQNRQSETSLNPFAVSKYEAARLLGISVRSVENYIAAKLLEARKIGTRRVVLVRSLEKFLRSDQPSVSHSCRRGAKAREVRP
jgi:predicted transcriptional regulator